MSADFTLKHIMSAQIEKSLALLADSETDIYQRIYALFYGASDEARSLMEHMDELTKGRMLDEVTRLLMTEDVELEQTYLDFELKNHELAYNVSRPMYRQLFNAFADAVRETAGDSWTQSCEDAWRARVKFLSEALESADTGNL